MVSGGSMSSAPNGGSLSRSAGARSPSRNCLRSRSSGSAGPPGWSRIAGARRSCGMRWTRRAFPRRHSSFAAWVFRMARRTFGHSGVPASRGRSRRSRRCCSAPRWRRRGRSRTRPTTRNCPRARKGGGDSGLETMRWRRRSSRLPAATGYRPGPGGDSGMRWPDERKLHLLVHLQTPHVVRPIWEKGRSEMSKRTAEESDGNGHPDFILRGLGPINPRTGVLEMRVGQYMELELLEIPRDGQQGGKLKLVKLSNAVLHQAHKLKLPIAGVAGVLGSMILGRGFYLDSVGEFFQLYGRFEQMLGLTDEYRQPEIEREMRDRLGDEVAQHSREYERDGKKSSKPLPLYVRNTLAHSGTNPANVLGDGDLETSIRLLKDWLGQ